MNAITFSSFCSSGAVKATYFPIASFVCEKALSPAQRQALWRPILDDFERLRIRGAGGARFTVAFAKADMEVRSNSWRLPHYNSNSHTPCSECQCDRVGLRPYTDLTPSARWRATTIGPKATDQFIARCGAADLRHPLMASVFR